MRVLNSHYDTVIYIYIKLINVCRGGKNESVQPNMPEIINLLKCFSCTLGLDSVALVLVLVQHVRVIVCMCVCVREGEGVGCAWVCLTFNILTSYFKNVKLCKHVALAVCLPPPPFPACPALLLFVSRVSRSTFRPVLMILPSACLSH